MFIIIVSYYITVAFNVQGKSFDPSDTAEVRKYVSNKLQDYKSTDLAAYGDKLFPAFNAILSDDNVSNDEITNIYSTLIVIGAKHDCSRFTGVGKDLLLKRKHDTWVCKYSDYLVDRGGKADTKLTLLLLSHSNDVVAINSMMHLLNNCDKEEYDLVRIWMKSDRYRNMANVNVPKIDIAVETAKKRLALDK